MMSEPWRWRAVSILGSLAMFGLVAVSCSSDEGDAVEAPAPTESSGPGVSGEVVVFAAASLTEAFT